MKKLLVTILILELINILFNFINFSCFVDDECFVNKCDTSINTIRIDSIEYNIIKKDSLVINIKQKRNDEIKKANTISDSNAIKLFKELVTE